MDNQPNLDHSHITSATRTFDTKSPNSPKKPKGTLRLFIIFFGVGILVISGLYTYIKLGPGKSITNFPCASNTELIATSLEALQSHNADTFRSTVTKISAIKGNQDDVNCLYILTQASIQLGDSVNASNYYNMLKNKYKGNNVFVPAIVDTGNTLDSIGATVDFLLEQAKNLNNTYLGPDKK